MPGGDRRGPEGFGPMTGRGAGYCSGNTNPGFTTGGRGRYNSAPGRGFRGGGFQRGAGFRRWGGPDYYNAPGYGYAPAPQQPAPELRPEDEVRMLKARARFMEQEVQLANERIAELEELAAKEK